MPIVEFPEISTVEKTKNRMVNLKTREKSAIRITWLLQQEFSWN